MAGKPIRIAILANGRQARAEFGKTASSMSALGSASKALLGAAGLGSVGLALKKASGSFLDFDDAMTKSTAIMGKISGPLRKQMEDAARAVGKTTQFSATQAAESYFFLASAGLDAAQSVKAMPAVSRFAAAGNFDLARATDLATDAQSALGLAAKEPAKNLKNLTRVTDVFVKANTLANTSVEQISEAMTNKAGAAMRSLGLDIEEGSAVLAAFADQGVKGREAGTQFAIVLRDLQTRALKNGKAFEKAGIEVFDAAGNFRNMADILGDLEGHLKGMTSEQKKAALATLGFNDKSMSALTTLLGTSKAIKGYEKDLRKAGGTTKNVADKQMSSFKARLDVLKSGAEDFGITVGEHLIEGLFALGEGFKDGETSAEGFQGELQKIGKAIRPVADTVADFGKFLHGLPGPVKELGLQAGLAALILPRLSAGFASVSAHATVGIAKIRQFHAEMTYATTRSAALSTALGKLGGAAKAAAGVGGMVALTQGAQESDHALSGLLNVAGGAATGFAVGGPFGAAVGGAAGLLLSVEKAARGAKDEINSVKLHPAIAEYDDLKATLDDLTGAYTKASREAVYNDLVESGAAQNLQRLGIKRREAVDAVLRDGEARRKVAAALDEEKAAVERIISAKEALTRHEVGSSERDAAIERYNALVAEGVDVSDEAVASRQSVIQSIEGEIVSAQRAVAEKRKEIAATRVFTAEQKKLLKQLPKELRTRIIAEGADSSLATIKDLARKFKVNKPKDIEILVKTLRPDAEDRELARVVSRTQAFLKRISESEAKKNPPDVGKPIPEKAKESIEAGTQKVTGGLGQLLRKAAASVMPEARTGGAQVGAQLSAGLTTGVSDAGLAAKLRSIVRGALAAARAEAEIRSPSRKTRKIGQQLAQGLALGVTDGKAGVKRALEKVTRLVEKTIKLSDDKAERKRERAILRSLKRQRRALLRNGRAQDRINRKLEQARARLQEVRTWAENVKQTFIETGNLTTLGRLDDGSVSGTLMLDQLRQQVSQAKRFSALVRDLTAKGLNDTSLQQLLAAGPKAGLAIAEALIHGGQAAINEVNSLTKELTSTGAKLGRDMSGEFFDLGLSAAEGLVQGLQAKSKALDKAAEKLAKKLADKVKKKLGIRSPSRVFRDIGDDVMRGLSIGLDDTYVRRAGTATADALVKGFGTPALDAFASAPGLGQPMRVRVTFSAEQISQLQRGREIQADLDAYRQVGGKVASL